MTWQAGDLFAPMDQNLPEGDLFMRIRQLFPKQPMTPMHLLALVGRNGIGRLGYALPGSAPVTPPSPLDKATLLKIRYSTEVFDDLVAAYLSTGAGIAGMQPKIMVPERATVPIPSLIVKAASPAYPGLAANEFLCLSAARRAGILVPEFALSDDGQLLVLDRFDIIRHEDGRLARLGFEDIAALAGLRVRNGDAHLKNFGVLYHDASDIRLAPMFDVVTTAIYTYTRYPGGPELEDHTMALKLFAGRHPTRTYPTPVELIDFGHRVCGVSHPERVLEAIAQAMSVKDLEPLIGKSNRVYEILNRKRPLTLAMIRRLHTGLGIPADVLIAQTAAS